MWQSCKVCGVAGTLQLCHFATLPPMVLSWKRFGSAWFPMMITALIKAALWEKQYVETSRSSLSIFSGALLAYPADDCRGAGRVAV